ncbi:MAG: hypothetical protein ACREOM_10550 [Candidatus Dormibacteraceae bacterium]
MSSRPIGRDGRSSFLEGVQANARLTALTGALLIILLALLGLTILSIRRQLPLHFLLGFLVIPPLMLKIGSTAYRFVRYYTGDPRYREAGTPQPFLRFLAPLVVLSTVAVFATGIELWFFGLRFGSIWVEAHKLSFLAWLAITGVHVLAHVGRTAEVTAAEFSPTPPPDASIRRSLVVGSLVAGVALAIASLTYASPFIFFGDG